MLINIILFFLNLIFLFFGYYIIKNKIEKKVVNKQILNKIKDEINSMIIKLNETTVNNISLVDGKIGELNKRIILADKKKAGLKIDILKNKEDDVFKDIKEYTYSPKKVVKQSIKNTENLFDNVINGEISSIDDKIKDMTDIEKLNFLIDEGWDLNKIQKKLKISTGELELFLNTQKLRS